MNKKRYTIGFLFGDFYGAYTANLFFNIVKACREFGQNIIGFGGGFLKNPGGKVLGENCNYIFDLAHKGNIDGIILEGSIGNFISKSAMQKFLLKYPGIPIINIGTNIEGIHNILIDNKKGMEDLITHLVEYHNYKKIAFIAGTEGNFDATQRFEAYENVLRQHNIALDKNLIANGNFSYREGILAFETLEKRNAKYDALVCANDYMAISVMLEMQKRGLKIPENAAVAGFDDTEECWTVKPTLTTVKQPFYEIGQESVKLLISILDGKKTPESIVLPTELIIRESCGCKTVDKLNHVMGDRFRKNDSNKKHYIINDNKEFIDEAVVNINNELPLLKNKYNLKKWLKDLIDSYSAVKAGENKNRLFERFLEIFHRLIDSSEEIITIYKFISIFYHNLLNRFVKKDEKEEVTHLLNETLALFVLLVKEDESEKRAKLKLESHVVVEFNENFIYTFDIEKLKDVVLNNLPLFQFKNFFACLFEDKTLEKSRILMAYDKNKKEEISYGPFPSKNLLPSKINKKIPFGYIVMALNYIDEYFGYAIYDIQTLTTFIYESLSVQISGAIKGARLTNELNKYTSQLENKVKERTIDLEKANIKLKELDALKNDFIANITHDFRSPLTVILNAADLAIRFDTDINNEVKDQFNMIYKSSLRLKNSIDKLLELAKIDAKGIKLRIERVDLVSCLFSIVDYYTSSVMSSSIKIEKIFPDHKIENFYTDMEKLEEILDNVLSNAIKFIDPNTGVIKVELTEEEDDVLISVSDNGIGIPGDKLKVIFNRFEQLHEGNSPYRGTGIGLAFSKQLAEYLKGEIWAESDGEGKGSKFIIRLKKGREHFNEKDMSDGEEIVRKKKDIKTLIEAELEEKLHKENTQTLFEELNKENEYDYRKGIILIIDDDKNIREIIYKYLYKSGLKNFIVAPDGKQGLEAVYEYSPDIIICDFNMPNMKGDDLHNRLVGNPEYKEIPFIFLSAVADDRLMFERRELGAAAYLKKPIEEKLLIITIDEQLMKYYELKKIKQLATKDELTGLNNRRSILENLKRELSARNYRDISILFIDVDYFKEINDGYGHQAGDHVLSMIGKTIKASIRKYDIAGRYGGDEFIVILPEAGLNNAVYVAEVLRKAIIENKFKYQNKDLSITSSFGAASLRDNAEYIEKTLGIKSLKGIYEVLNRGEADWNKIEKQKERISELLLKMADEALYQAKKTKCNKCGFNSGKKNSFPGNKCPECGSDDLIPGRNRVVKFG